MANAFNNEMALFIKQLMNSKIPYEVAEANAAWIVEWVEPEEYPGMIQGAAFSKDTFSCVAEFMRAEGKPTSDWAMTASLTEDDDDDEDEVSGTTVEFELDPALTAGMDPDRLKEVEEYFLGLINNWHPDDEEDK
jgi:hypothetical protein